MYNIKITKSQTRKVAEILSKRLLPGDIVGLTGNLGVGKTTFVKMLVRLLKSKQMVSSPTFSLIQQYSGKINGKPIEIFHSDLYRIESQKEAEDLGFQEMFTLPNAIHFIEWADKFPQILPKSTIMIELKED